MKVVHLSTSDTGGAAAATLRLHRALAKQGVESALLVALKNGYAPDVISVADGFMGSLWNQTWPRLNSLVMRWQKSRPGYPFYPAAFSWGPVDRHPLVRSAEVVCLYWVAGFLSLETIGRLPGPIVWRLSDQWAFTGGCHYSGECQRFTESCGMCPVLTRQSLHDISWQGLRRRAEAWAQQEFVVVAPSSWMAKQAAGSQVFRNSRIEVIPTGVDLETFRLMDRAAMRAALGLPKDRRIILFGASNAFTDPRKGWPELRAALGILSKSVQREELHLATFGGAPPSDLPLPATAFGQVADAQILARLYAAADVLVVPSREDNLPNVALEGLACGTPVVGCAVGGMADAVVHRINGWLARPRDPEDLAKGIRWVLQQGPSLREEARRHAEAKFSLDVHTARYHKLLQDVAALRATKAA